MLGSDTQPKPAETAATSMLYTGEQYDKSLSQYYLRARYYNPLNGLFNQTAGTTRCRAGLTPAKDQRLSRRTLNSQFLISSVHPVHYRPLLSSYFSIPCHVDLSRRNEVKTEATRRRINSQLFIYTVRPACRVVVHFQ